MSTFNIAAIQLDASGRTILNDEVLAVIEQSFTPTAAGVTNPTSCNKTNNACTNEGSCEKSTNHSTCTNSGSCYSEGEGPIG